jgi:hypothetical protein
LPILALADEVQDDQIMSLPSRMRGTAILAYGFTPEVVEQMSDNGINLIRLQIDARNLDSETLSDPTPPTKDDPLRPYRVDLAYLHRSLSKCDALGIRVIVSPGNLYGRKLDVFWKQTGDAQLVREHLVEFWRAFSLEFKTYPAIVGYDIFNEPNYKPGDEKSWYQDMLPGSVSAIRKINSQVWLVVEPGPWGFADGLKNLVPLDDSRVIYSFHHYAPHGYTHQYLHAQKIDTIPQDRVYPGKLRMFYDNDAIHKITYWDKSALLESMKEAVNFQKRHKARILVGEFGAIRWAPGVEQWLKDSIDIFEQQGWDWCVIGYPTRWVPKTDKYWSGWNLSYNADDPRVMGPMRSGKQSPRMNILLDAWHQNMSE